MPKQVEIEIFCIAKTQVQHEAVVKWLEFLDVPEDFDIDPEDVTDPAFLIALAAKRCYKSFAVGMNPNIVKVRNDYAQYLDNVMKSGHGSVLEHASFSFAIENVSRVFTAEMNRHRAGMAISEGSLRFIRFDVIPYWLPLSLRPDPADSAEIRMRKEETCGIFAEAFRHQEEMYRNLAGKWAIAGEVKTFAEKKKLTSLFRRIVGMGVATGGVWTGNVRALRHIMTMRCEPAAEEEIAHVFTRIADMMIQEEPMLFGDFTKPDGYYKPGYRKV